MSFIKIERLTFDTIEEAEACTDWINRLFAARGHVMPVVDFGHSYKYDCYIVREIKTELPK